jgi:integrase
MNQAAELLAIAADDPIVKGQIADLIVATVKATKKLPDPDEVRRKVRTGQELDEHITTGQWLDRWINSRKKIRSSTRTSYQTHIDLYLKPTLGHIPLDKLRVHHVEEVFETIDDLNETIIQARTSGNPKLLAKVKGRRVVSPATKQRIRATLRAALNHAIKQRLLNLNVASLIELESGKRPKALVWTPERLVAWKASRDAYIEEIQERHRRAYQAGSTRRKTLTIAPLDAYTATPRPSAVMVWTPEQTSIFLDRSKSHRLYALFHLIAYRGLRRGEGCGLRWPDLNLNDGAAHIRWQITKITGGTAQGVPKSDAGDRQVQLDNDTKTVLRAHKARQNAERLAAGQDWADTGFVFTTETGQPLDPAEVSDQFLRMAMEAGLPPIRLHDLRHGAATILLLAGHDMKVVQETLGLSSITIAADTYTSVLPTLARQSAEDAATILRTAKSTTPTAI